MYKQFDYEPFDCFARHYRIWQVSGRSDISYEERVRLDMYYVRNWSIWFDFQLLFQTIPAVLRAMGLISLQNLAHYH